MTSSAGTHAKNSNAVAEKVSASEPIRIKYGRAKVYPTVNKSANISFGTKLFLSIRRIALFAPLS